MKIPFRTSGLYVRIMLPAASFVLIFSFLFIGLNHFYTSRLLDRRMEREASRISKMLYESRFILNHAYLKRLGEVIEGKVAVFDSTDRIVAASFDSSENERFQSRIDFSKIRQSLLNRTSSVRKLVFGKERFLLASRQLFSHGPQKSAIVTILTPMNDLQTMKDHMVAGTLIAGLLALAAALGGAWGVMRSVRADLKDILHVTRSIAGGDFKCKAMLPKNISELEDLAESVNRMSDRLLAYERQMVDSTRLASAAQITRAMAHEIKNPLSSMKMLAQILRRNSSDDKELGRTADVLINEIDRVDRLVSDIGTASGKGKYVFKKVPAQIPLQEVMDMAGSKLTHLKIEAETVMVSDLPEVLMDKDRIKQVLWNLLKNGMESMPEGGKIKVSLEAGKEPNSVEYAIRDFGCGIGRADLENVFAPFHTTKKEGIGIGLHVSREIARAHKGDLKLLCKDDGTVAVLMIPIGKEGYGQHTRGG